MTEKNELHPAAQLSSFHIEADRCSSGIKMFVSGVVGISEYCAENIMLKSHCCKMMIFGKRLKICVYENNTVEVVGKIGGIEFIYGKN